MNLLATAPDWMVWLLTALLAAATVQDAVQLRISNLITIPVLALAFVAMSLAGFRISLWQNFLVFTTVLAVGTLLFSRRILGGADVKLFAAVGLWSDLRGALTLIAAILICGGLLAVAILLLRAFSTDRIVARIKTLQPRAGIPYGIAIAAGTMLVMVAWSRQPQEKAPLSTIAPVPNVRGL